MAGYTLWSYAGFTQRNLLLINAITRKTSKVNRAVQIRFAGSTAKQKGPSPLAKPPVLTYFTAKQTHALLKSTPSYLRELPSASPLETALKVYTENAYFTGDTFIASIEAENYRKNRAEEGGKIPFTRTGTGIAAALRMRRRRHAGAVGKPAGNVPCPAGAGSERVAETL